MRLSHRDRRVARDISRSAWGMLGLVVVLAGLALYAPLEGFRFASVIGLAVAGGVFLWRADSTVQQYVLDLDRVQSGSETSGRVRVEVTSDTAVDEREVRLPRAIPAVRRQAIVEPSDDESDSNR